MNPSLHELTWQGIALSFLPVAVAVLLLARWSLAAGTALYALARMLVQLLAVGMVLSYLFAADHAALVVGVLAVMVAAASWIALRPIAVRTPTALRNAFAAIALAGGLTLALVTQLVLSLDPWYDPRYLIPLAGMVFANAMNSVSLAAERFEAESAAGAAPLHARDAAMRAALIPLLNSLFAVGLVSLPGMMTGQILSGVAPVVAAQYQVVVMTMIFGAGTLAAALYLHLATLREATGA